ncbi:phosphoribosyltransferase [candidate division MSBL1 archaeon SCGC-AAA259E19]|uniref:Phosphoribosyltransferase n=2 Tax=candidate division MSBL1 TaxID=215777 RepID=A0A133UJ12_9EURY|nr:phosphoribosyltransferase [candidate division MSBL1 archaeon SCGC-AAA259E19]
MFKDRKDAGEKLAHALEKYKGKDVLVLAIPRGGVEVGYRVAKHLDANFSLLVTRKLPLPDNPEAGFGAITEDGSKVILERAAGRLTDRVIDEIVEKQEEEIDRRIKRLREGPLPEIEGETVVLVDDGMAMGSTMRASIKLCKNKNAERIVVAVPVSSEEVARKVGEIADEVVVLEKPEFFRAVAQVYEQWHDVSSEEALQIAEKREKEQ